MVVRHFTTANGLPVGSAAAARADGDGFLWIATHDGLARFDGRDFDIHDSARSPQIGGNRFVSLQQDDSGYVYALSADGTVVRARGSVVEALPIGGGQRKRIVDASFMHANPICVTLPAGIHCAASDGQFVREASFAPALGVAAALRAAPHRFWLIVPGRGLLLQYKQERPVPLKGGDFLRLERDRFIAQVDGRGNLWIASQYRLARVGLDGRITQFSSTAPEPAEIVQLRIDRAGHVWVGSDRGVFRIQEGSDAMQPVPAPAGFPAQGLTRSWQDPADRLWIARGGQLFCDGLQVLSSPGEILDVYFDHAGIAWVSTLRDSLYALSAPRVDTIDKSDGLRSDNVYGIDVAPDGTLWIGALGGGIHALRPDGRIDRYGPAQGLPGENTHAVAVSPDGEVYTATYRPGLRRLPFGAKTFEPVALPLQLAHAQVLSLSFDDRRRLWIGTGNGVWRRDTAGWRRIWPDTGSAQVGAVLHAADGSLWFGGDHGLYRMAHGQAHAVARKLLDGITVRGLFQDAAGTIWASTEGRGLVGIDADDPRGDHARQLGRAQGLPSNSPHSVLQDAQGSLWINSNQGIHRITQQALSVIARDDAAMLSPLSIGLPDGLIELEGNGGVQPAAARGADGILWFPTQRGVVRIDPASMPVRPNRSRTVIDRTLDLRSGRPFDVARPLPAGVRSIQIAYSAADLHGAERLRFRYRLLPAHEQWTTAEHLRTASFMALPPGRHRFEVVAGNGDGVWYPEPTVVEFSVPYYWYETAWFKFACVALLAGAGGLLLRWRLRDLRRRTALLDRKVRHRTAKLSIAKTQAETALTELAALNARLERNNLTLATQTERLEGLDAFRTRLLADIGHELRTPLMLIGVSLREIETADELSAPILRRRIHQSLLQVDRLDGLVDQLVQLVLAEARRIELDFGRIDPGEFVKDTMAAFLPLAQRNALGFEIACAKDLPSLMADVALLTTILGNLISNACRHAPRGSVVHVDVGHDANAGYVRIGVADEGPGLSAQAAKRMFDRFYRGATEVSTEHEGLGIGLALARELVLLHGGRIGADSEPGHGARLWIELPTGTAHVALEEIAIRSDHACEAVVRAPQASRRVVAARQQEDAGRSLLLLEDHRELGDYLEERLSERMQILRAYGAAEATSILETMPVAVLLADVLLPDASGLEVCRQLRSQPRYDGVPVVLMSARSSREDREAGIAAGAAAYLAKPFSFEQLLGTLEGIWPELAETTRKRREANAKLDADPLIAIASAAIGDAAFGVSQWADMAHLSERQLRRRVVDLTGLPPQTWLREQRLEKVRHLISSGQCRTLAQAGAQTGFDNADYLYRLYRAKYGS